VIFAQLAGALTAINKIALDCDRKTLRGETDIVLLERNQLTSGTSWHAAGIVGPLRATPNMTRLAMYAGELFPKLEAETGLTTGYRKTGGAGARSGTHGRAASHCSVG